MRVLSLHRLGDSPSPGERVHGGAGWRRGCRGLFPRTFRSCPFVRGFALPPFGLAFPATSDPLPGASASRRRSASPTAESNRTPEDSGENDQTPVRARFRVFGRRRRALEQFLQVFFLLEVSEPATSLGKDPSFSPKVVRGRRETLRLLVFSPGLCR